VAPWCPVMPAVMPSTTTTTRRLRAVAGAVALAVVPLVVSACGGGNDPVTPITTTVTVTPSSGSSKGTTSTTSTTTTTTPAAQPPKTYEQAMQHFAAGKIDAAAKPQFTSPTGNIYCSIAPSGAMPAGCELRDGRVTAPAGTCPPGAAAKDVGRIEWSGDTPKPVCNSDTMMQPGAPVLQYGAIAMMQGSPFQCISESIGVTCINTAGKKGFFLAKGAYSIF